MKTIAIYSRKSIFTSKGESIESQIELCRTYYNSYVNDGNTVKYIIYEDEGFSGKNIQRPQFQHMINDIKSKKINTLICYRLDRISRNVADFASTLELLQKYEVNFISIKEQFDTSTPLGRAMIYIASVFAQLERETIAERVHDNMIHLAKSGRWLGGTIPYGFNIEKKSYLNDDLKEKTFSILIPNEKEIQIIKFIYSSYIRTHSIRQVSKILCLNFITGKKGGNIDLTQIRRILRNPLYVISDNASHQYLLNKKINVCGAPNGNGYITYNKNSNKTLNSNKKDYIAAIGNHKGVISSDEWLKVQAQLDNNKIKISRTGTGKNNSLLTGILKCKKCNSNMIIKFSGRNKENIPYKYYVCPAKYNNSTVCRCTANNIRVDNLDFKVLSSLNVHNDKLLLKTLKSFLDANLNCHSKNEDTFNIESKINENQNLIDNLIKQLSKSTSETISKRIMVEITRLDNKILELKKHINIIDSKKSPQLSNQLNSRYFINSLKSLTETMKLLNDIKQKRFLMQILIKNIIWNSDDNKVFINLNH